jgi:DNA polymerase III subunit epsilon
VKTFVALDFETADHGPDSACAVALVRVEEGRLVSRERRLIRPPRRQFVFTGIHGIAWSDVADAPGFGDAWPELRGLLDGAEFIAAHNAAFDRNVLRACCYAAGWGSPAQPWVCTVRLARRTWRLASASLPSVCRHLGLQLNHHEPLSDAEACANIVLAALADGADLGLEAPPKKKTRRKAVAEAG